MRKTLVWLVFGLFVLFVARLIYLADMGRGHRFFFWAAHIPAGDKVAHAFLFGTLALLANVAMDAARFQWGKITVLKGSLLVLIPTVIEEFSQLHFRSRSFDLFDLLADVIGISIGGWLAVMLDRHFSLFKATTSLVRSDDPTATRRSQSSE